MLATLKEVFGFQEFRPNQEAIVTRILAKRDVFAVMPTGGGKSLCYQLPATLLPGTAVVISPLISLMKDQVDGARENGISAAFLNSSLTPDEKTRVYRALREDRLDLLYIAPERFAIPGFLDTLQGIPISLFAVDEAHCISEWGHDFRPDYLSLSGVTRTFSDVPVAAFTATATLKVQEDIINRLELRSPYKVRASFNRPNLIYRVHRKEKVERQIVRYIEEHPGDPGIIYRTTRESVVNLAETLVVQGFRALPYHAGMEADERKRNQEAFNRDEATIIVATIAFGMGIDKSNVRFVIHADLPKNIESYYQETGRAGRDGEPADCLLFFGRGDSPKIRYFIDKVVDDTEREVAMEKLNQMVGYASHHVCRRRQLLGYFQESYPEDNCRTCDVCLHSTETVDLTTDAQILMSAMARTGQRFGIRHIIEVVTGADTKRIRQMGHDRIKTHGAGSHKDRRHWHLLVDELLAQGLIEQEGSRYPVIKITEQGLQVLTGKQGVHGIKREERKPPEERARAPRLSTQSGTYDPLLFERLRGLRKSLAQKQGVPPYIIFSDRTLREMAARFPTTPEAMRMIHGVGDRKLDRYGDLFTEEIEAHLGEAGRGAEKTRPAAARSRRTKTA
jgi:ATP-dependent DNA helicase RecQ